MVYSYSCKSRVKTARRSYKINEHLQERDNIKCMKEDMQKQKPFKRKFLCIFQFVTCKGYQTIKGLTQKKKIYPPQKAQVSDNCDHTVQQCVANKPKSRVNSNP